MKYTEIARIAKHIKINYKKMVETMEYEWKNVLHNSLF